MYTWKNVENVEFLGEFFLTLKNQGFLRNFLNTLGNFRNCIFKFKFCLSENIISFSSTKCR